MKISLIILDGFLLFYPLISVLGKLISGKKGWGKIATANEVKIIKGDGKNTCLSAEHF